jgi:hypothetical protein
MNIQTFAKNVGDYGCLAFCYLYIACKLTNTKWDDIEALRIIKQAMEMKYLDDDCFVRDPCGLMKLATGKRFDVSKTTIQNARSPYVCVKYERGGHGHWTVWDVNSGLEFNSLDFSQCVVNGTPNLNDVRDVVLRS